MRKHDKHRPRFEAIHTADSARKVISDLRGYLRAQIIRFGMWAQPAGWLWLIW
jgi:hypothetical protein